MSNSLYERLGGATVEAHMNNPLIKARFLPYRDDPDTIAKVKHHTCNFFGAGSGGRNSTAAAACGIRIAA